MSPRDELAFALLKVRARLRTFFARLREGGAAGVPTLLGATVVAAVLISLQFGVPPIVTFGSLLLGGVAVGVVIKSIRDAVLAGFMMGYVAFFAGTTASSVWVVLLGRSPSPGWELLAGPLAGLAFGAIAGVWSAGAAGIVSVLRRRPHAGHVL